jgi:hypothetical protein
MTCLTDHGLAWYVADSRVIPGGVGTHATDQRDRIPGLLAVAVSLSLWILVGVLA